MFLNKLSVFDESRKAVKKARKIVDVINKLEPEISKLTDEQLKGKTQEFKKRLEKGESLDDILPEAFAVVREASKRVLGLRHYDVQLIGGIVLHNADIAEMRTGEGKTLVATLPAYLNALTGKGVHIVTVNDYLSRRDATWMGQIYNFLGLEVGVINTDHSYLYKEKGQGTPEDKERDKEGSYKVEYDFLEEVTRTRAYKADIVYGTNHEFGFDYLRDNLAYSRYELRQRELNYAIVDEVDSILIDEARTPLIISASTKESKELYKKFAEIVRFLKEGEDYEVDEKHRAIQIKDSGIQKVEKMLNIKNLYSPQYVSYTHHLEIALKAKSLFKKDTHYLVKDGEIVIVDEFTGRMQPGRRWSEGIHQAIEAKEGVEIKEESKTFASITYQNYFRLYNKLAGMTGTAKSSEEEFQKVYNLSVVQIPTHKPVKRIDHEDLIYQTEKGKFKAIAKKVKQLHEKGQPVLIGTVSVEKNELLSAFLKREGIPHQVLNAKNHEEEGEIIANAGKKGAVTVATNMAGRGVDIKLGGANASKEEYEEVKKVGGLFVLGTQRHEARRIDDQLRGRAGRQGDPGESQFYVSLEDDLMRIFAGDTIKAMMGKFGIPEDEPIYNKMITKALENAQKKIEGYNFDVRKQVLAYDDVLNRQRQHIYNLRRRILLSEEGDLIEILSDLIGDKDLLEKKQKELEDEFARIARELALKVIDMLWSEHLEAMDYLRSSVNLRAYGQRDPLIEYKKEARTAFEILKENISAKIREILSNIEKPKKETETTQAVQKQENKANELNKVGRNDPCPCGSGKKYKKCCLNKG